MYRNKIRYYRTKKGLTLKEVADKCGISAGYLCHLEKGKRENPSIEVMENIAIILGESIPEIFFPK